MEREFVPTRERATERVVVALDSSPGSIEALRVAAQLAAQLQAELHGIFVEDANLLRLCDLPFGQEVGQVSATSRRLDSRDLERQFRALAAVLEQATERIAESMQVPWSFQVKRGHVADELLAAARDSQLLSLGRYRRSPGSPVGAAVEMVVRQSQRPVFFLGKDGGLVRPFTLVYTGSEQAERALKLATRLAQRTDRTLHIILPMSREDAESALEHLTDVLGGQGISIRVIQGTDSAALSRLLDTAARGTLILPAEHADQLARLKGAVILVP